MKKILVIDDNQTNLNLIEALLHQGFPDYQVFLSLSGREGIEIAKQILPDTILLDIMMPEMDGYEVCLHLKANEPTRHIPILLVSAMSEKSYLVKGLNAGADAFISKPVDPSELKAQVNVMLRIKYAEDLLRKRNEKLNNLNYELTITEEKERRKIAEYLHDGLGQTISIAAIKLSSIARGNLSPVMIKTLDESAELLRNAIIESRTLIYDLSSPILYQFGLMAAIKWKLEQIEKTYEMNTVFCSNEDTIILKTDKSILIYRMVCELLNNTIKHAHAKLITVEIENSVQNIRIRVNDNGNGFKWSPGLTLSDLGGFGLFSINERLDVMQGSMEIESKPFKGASITLTIPN